MSLFLIAIVFAFAVVIAFDLKNVVARLNSSELNSNSDAKKIKSLKGKFNRLRRRTKSTRLELASLKKQGATSYYSLNPYEENEVVTDEEPIEFVNDEVCMIGGCC